MLQKPEQVEMGLSIPSPSGQGDLHYGLSGAICKIENGTVQRILTGLPSVAFPDGSGAAGPHDIKFDADGTAYVLLGYAANPAFRESLGDTNLGTIITFKESNNTWSSIVDITNCEVINKIALKDNEVASNPLSLYVDKNKLVIVDAGANSLFSVNTDGSDLRLIAAIPERILTNPIFPGAKSQNFDRGHVPAPGAYPQAPPSKCRFNRYLRMLLRVRMMLITFANLVAFLFLKVAQISTKSVRTVSSKFLLQDSRN